MGAFAFVALGVVLGVVAAWLALNGRGAGARAGELAALGARLEESQRQLLKADAELAAGRERNVALESRQAGLEASLAAEKQSLEREREAFQQSRTQLVETFQNLAGQTLGDARRQLSDDFERKQKLSGELLAQKEAAIDTLLQPVKESLAKLEAQSQQLEVKREGAYSDIAAQIEEIRVTHTALRQETSQLVTALRNPKIRGNWGELQLRRCIEFAGMVKHCDFVEQVATWTDQEKRRHPDVIISLPNGRSVVIDAKTPLEAFLSATTATDEAQKASLMAAHARQVKQHLENLCTKAYWQQFGDSPELVVCFLPSEVLFSAALEVDPALITFNPNVVLATPTTLIALLRAIACGWQQMEVARNAAEIREVALAIYNKLSTATDKVQGVGNALKRAVESYNGFLTTVQGRGGIFSQGRKLHDLSIGDGELELVAPTEMAPSALTDEDWHPKPLLTLTASEGQREERAV
jgi:DNA recombination protein RmuC